MKEGKNTTELLFCLLALILVNVGAFFVTDHPVVHACTVIGDALIAAGYTFCRTSLKKEEVKANGKKE